MSVNHLPQRLALDVLHGDEQTAPAFAYFVNRADVWVVQGGGQTGLTEKAQARRAVTGQTGVEQF